MQLRTLLTMLCFVEVEVATNDSHSPSLVQFCTVNQASIEFGYLVEEIIKELEKDKGNNLSKLKTISSALTVQKDSKDHVFTDKQLEEIQACNDIRTILTHKLRHCYRWDDCSMLTMLMLSVNSENCLSFIKKFEIKISSKMKLKQIFEHCKQKDDEFPKEYHKVVAIVEYKIFSNITLEEYRVLKHFVSEHCGVENYVISPFVKASSSSLILEWYIPITAVDHMIEVASSNKSNFTGNCFVFLKISSSVIFDHRDMVSVSLYR